jgi:hypothetical protein
MVEVLTEDSVSRGDDPSRGTGDGRAAGATATAATLSAGVDANREHFKPLHSFKQIFLKKKKSTADSRLFRSVFSL